MLRGLLPIRSVPAPADSIPARARSSDARFSADRARERWTGRPAGSALQHGRRPLAAFLLLLVLAGCYGVVPEARKYFHHDTPMSALLGFAYAVEVGDWEYAFESLDEASRDAFETAFRFQWGVRLQSDPDYDIPVRDLISQAIRYRSSPRIVPGERPLQEITLFYVPPRSRDCCDGDAPEDAGVDSPALPPSVEGPIPAAVFEQAKIILPIYLVREDGAWRIDLIGTLGTSYRDQLAFR